jgi:hypothetical protein
MKFLPVFLLIILISFSSCDPDNKDIFNIEAVKIAATLNNTSQTINLGDTLKITATLPDTIINQTGTFPVQSLQRAQFYMYINKIDTINVGRATLILPPNYWTTRGRISPTNTYSFEFTQNAKPYGVVINFKPTEKGIYYLEVVSQAGQLEINNSYEARLFVNFNVLDKHLTLAAPYLGGQAWLDNAALKDAEGFGKYVFRVN